MNKSRMNEIWLAELRSSKEIHELYIPVVNVETLKIDTVPKSDKHSIATKAKPAIIAGLAEGSIIFNKVSFSDRPRFWPASI